MSSSEALTRGIRVRVEAEYAPAQSAPLQSHWLFRYTVAVANEGTGHVQLVSRHWIITDAADRTEEVKGLGVVGQQPVIGPGEQFVYTSSCPLPTPTGTMRGTYHVVTPDGGGYDVEIAPFRLEAPYSVH